MKIALAQINSQDDWRRNLLIAISLIQRASKRSANAILFPENMFYMGDPQNLRQWSQPIQRFAIPAIQETARKNKTAVLIGSYPEPIRGSKRVFNTSLFIDERGKIVGRYRKIHLFDVTTPEGDRYAESKFVQAGKQPVVFAWRGVRIGMSVCFDIRFPEHYRHLSRKRADWLLIPSAFTHETGKAHWHTLLRARAIENLSYVFAPAQTGRHPQKRKTFGHSLAVSPWGKVQKDTGVREGIYYFEIGPRTVQATLRRRFLSL